MPIRLVWFAGELYPTEVRTTAHGMSAGVAKVGALWATIWFNYQPLDVSRSVSTIRQQLCICPALAVGQHACPSASAKLCLMPTQERGSAIEKYAHIKFWRCSCPELLVIKDCSPAKSSSRANQLCSQQLPADMCVVLFGAGTSSGPLPPSMWWDSS